MLRETYRLTKENNDMLHKMRRTAFLGSVVKVIFYILVLVVAPLWIYQTYLSPILKEALQTYSQVQGTSQQAQGEMQKYQDFLKQIQSTMSNMPNLGTSSGE